MQQSFLPGMSQKDPDPHSGEQEITSHFKKFMRAKSNSALARVMRKEKAEKEKEKAGN
mgnify:CR=1 FL=1